MACMGEHFLGNQVGPERTYAFSARDRVDETVNRVREMSVVKNIIISATISPIKPLMRRLMAEGKLSGRLPI